MGRKEKGESKKEEKIREKGKWENIEKQNNKGER